MLGTMKYAWIWILLILGLIGCGGGGSTTSTSGGTLSLYATDSMDGNDQVWVQLHKVELLSTLDRVTVFQDDAGKTINLRALRDGSGARFLFLGQTSVPAGEFTTAILTLSRDVNTVPAGQTNALKDVFDDKLLKNGFTEIQITLDAPRQGNDSLILDFDLANWVNNGGVINPVVKSLRDGTLSDAARHEKDDLKGTISALTPTSFVLNMAFGRTIQVNLSSTTVISRSDGAANPALANGQIVKVLGTVLPAEKRVQADQVTIKIDDNGDVTDEVKGTITQVNDLAYDLIVTRARGFLPPGSKVRIQATGTTAYLNNLGQPITKAEFQAALGTGTVAEAEGNFAAGVLTAEKLKLEGNKPADNPAELKGTTQSLDEANGKFTVRISEWFGFGGTLDQDVVVKTTSTTVFLDGNGATLTKAAFFAAAAQRTVDAKGAFVNGELVAIRARIKK